MQQDGAYLILGEALTGFDLQIPKYLSEVSSDLLQVVQAPSTMQLRLSTHLRLRLPTLLEHLLEILAGVNSVICRLGL